LEDFKRVPVGLTQVVGHLRIHSDKWITLEEFLEQAAVAEVIAVDTETNGKNILDGTGYCQGVSIAYRHPEHGLISHYLPFRHLFGDNLSKHYLDQLKEVLESRANQNKPSVYHNSKFDIASLDTLGIDVYTDWDGPTITRGYHYCTMLMSHLLDENIYAQSLDNTSKVWINDTGKKESAVFKSARKAGWQYIPSSVMYEYAAYDANVALRLFEHLHPLFVAEGLVEYWATRKLKTIRVFQSMEKHGVSIDNELCESMRDRGLARKEDIVELLGGLNPGSSKDLAKLLIDELKLPVLKRSVKTGNPSFAKDVMEEYDSILDRLDDETAKLILAYRGWTKTVSSNYVSYLNLVSPDGRLRPNYKLHGTKTGRVSCTDPNLQQIPKISSKPWNGKLKNSFIPRPGWALIEADYSQLEFRITASVAREQSLFEVFDDPSRDVFTELAATLRLGRQNTKTFMYATGYGAGIERIHFALGVTRDRAKEIRDDYWNKYPKIKLASDLAKATAIRDGRVRIWSGRFRHFKHKSESRKAFNSWIQGGAADIVEGVMHRLYKEVESDTAHMLLQVHDSVVFEIREDVLEETKTKIREIMENVEGGRFGITFRVDIHNWGE
jgi:DNA polymerase I